MTADDLKLNPANQEVRTREDMRRIEEWAKKRREAEQEMERKARRLRHLLLGA